MNYCRYIKSTRPELLILFVVAFLTLVFIDFWLINIPEVFAGGSKLGQIIYRLCLSYISAFIFYFLVVHVKNQKDKENLYSYIAKKVRMVIGAAKGIAGAMAKEANVELSGDFPTKLELSKICKGINPNGKAPMLLGVLGNHANWLQYFDTFKRRSNEATEKVFLKMQFLDSRLVNHLAKVEDCTHFTLISQVQFLPITNTDLCGFESSILEYFQLVENLDEYYQKKLKAYNLTQH